MNRTACGDPTAAANWLTLATRIVLLVGALVPMLPGALAQTLPAGFSAARLFPTTALSGPTALAYTPDGLMLIAQIETYIAGLLP